MTEHPKRALIIQGGGFRTGFSAGILDAFLQKKYFDFDIYAANSGGAIALSYFLGRQEKKCFEAMCFMATNKNFMSYFRVMSEKGIMDVDYFHEVATKKIPFDLTTALENSNQKIIGIVLTDIESGEAEHHHPSKKTWVDAVIASCTLPFVTKGKHNLNGKEYMDGGWSDPLPVEWAYAQGATEIIILRTLPPNLKMNQSWPDYFGSIYHRSNDVLRTVFEKNHLIYNASIDFINHPPKGLKITQIAPEQPLKAGTYTNSIEAITTDYNYGFESATNYLNSL